PKSRKLHSRARPCSTCPRGLADLASRVTGVHGGPQGGLFVFKFSSRAHPRKFGLKLFLVMRSGPISAEVGWPVLGLPPWKKLSAARSRSSRSAQEDAAVCRAELCYPFGGKHGGIGQ